MNRVEDFLLVFALIIFFVSIFLTFNSSQISYAFIGLPEEYVSVYQNPSSYSRVIGKAGNGEIGKVLGKSQDWCLIETEKGLKGYVFHDVLDLIQMKKF